MNRRPVIGAAVCAATIFGFGGSAFAGEITGNGKSTPIREHRAASICAFSGLEDGIALIGFTSEGVPIFIEVDSGPGLVQTPHHEPAADIIHDPGVAGEACRGGGPRDD